MKPFKGIKTLTVSMLLGISLLPGLALAQKTFVFDPQAHRWYAYDNGELIKSGIASGGKGYCPDTGRRCKTPSGVFSVIGKGGPECKSTRYPVGVGGAPMPYCMFFTKYYAVHGSNQVSGTANLSHGCVRVETSAARWLNQNFMTIGTKVVVKSY